MWTTGLVLPRFVKDFVVQANVLEVGLGAVLSEVWNGEEHLVVYLSRKLKPYENYVTFKKEYLAVKWALDPP